MVSQLGGINHRRISTIPPRMKSVAAPVDPSLIAPRPMKGEYVPVCVALGLIFLSVSLGLYTAKHQLMYAPNVFVSKKKRETVPEVVEPEYVVEVSEKFLTKHLIRKMAHVLDMEKIVGHPIQGDPFKIPKRAETLKSVGVDPKAI
ncbi:hypothetical protein ACLOJK_023768 [Asimina triloba]